MLQQKTTTFHAHHHDHRDQQQHNNYRDVLPNRPHFGIPVTRLTRVMMWHPRDSCTSRLNGLPSPCPPNPIRCITSSPGITWPDGGVREKTAQSENFQHAGANVVTLICLTTYTLLPHACSISRQPLLLQKTKAYGRDGCTDAQRIGFSTQNLTKPSRKYSLLLINRSTSNSLGKLALAQTTPRALRSFGSFGRAGGQARQIRH